MLEDALVQMLLDAGGGEVRDQHDITLARAAARWAQRRGWKLHLRNSFFFEVQALSFWILVVRASQTLEIRVRLEHGTWQTHAQHHIDDLGHGLDILAAEKLLPPMFSPIGRRALDCFAEALDRGASELGRLGSEATAAEIAEFGENYRWEMGVRAAVMGQAAAQARAFPRSELAVMT